MDAARKDWIGAFVSGRWGLWRTVAVIWVIASLTLLFQFRPWNGLGGMDTDDAMRIVQIRDWLAGQSWFDTTQYRGDPPQGFSMHWSRIPDLLIGGLIAAFGLFAPANLAEQAAMTAWPLLQLFVALLLIALIARELGGRAAAALGPLLYAMTGTVAVLFHPGRIDHHGLQVVGTLAMCAAIMRFRRGERRAGMLAALAAALTLAVGLEAILFWLTACAVVTLAVVVDPKHYRAPAIAYGLTLATATPLASLATNPARHVLSSACDQAALPVLGMAMAGGLGIAFIAAVGGRLRSPAARLALAVAVGAAAAGAFLAIGPSCVRGPLADVDPRLKPIWLDLVNETLSLGTQLRKGDALGYIALGQILLGSAAVAILAARPSRRDVKLALMGGLLLIASAMTVVYSRTAPYAVAFACPLAAAAICEVVSRLRAPRRHRTAALLAGVLATLAPSAAASAWLAADEGSPKPKSTDAPSVELAQAKARAACRDPETYRSLPRLEPGLAAAPIDAGPYILMRTPLSVLSAPYHRNTRGMLTAQAILTAAPDRAEALARRRGVRYVVVCLGAPSTKVVAKVAPDGLAARLVAGASPAWLEPLPADEGPVRAWRLR